MHLRCVYTCNEMTFNRSKSECLNIGKVKLAGSINIHQYYYISSSLIYSQIKTTPHAFWYMYIHQLEVVKCYHKNLKRFLKEIYQM